MTGIAKVSALNGQLRITPLVFTSTELFWDDGNISKTIPSDGVERYLNLAYLDQNTDAWQLAIEKQKRTDYFKGWHKIDVTISSATLMVEPIRVEIAMGFAGERQPASPLNPKPWDWWHQAIMKEMQQAPDKKDFRL